MVDIIELVIKIPKEFYEYCKAQEDAIEMQLAVKDGTPLPQGHGRLGDLDALKVSMRNEIIYGGSNEYGCLSLVDEASTIIEADEG